jgi:hypothetical protein
MISPSDGAIGSPSKLKPYKLGPHHLAELPGGWSPPGGGRLVSPARLPRNTWQLPALN